MEICGVCLGLGKVIGFGLVEMPCMACVERAMKPVKEIKVKQECVIVKKDEKKPDHKLSRDERIQLYREKYKNRKR